MVVTKTNRFADQFFAKIDTRSYTKFWDKPCTSDVMILDFLI